MPLRSARLTGDPVLENCFLGQHRMLEPESGLPVYRLQSALLELGRPVGPKGADGIFGHDTGAAVTAYKTDKGLVPNDPVVGPGTSKALDDDLFVDPPTLDPAYAEFSPAVVDHRLEQFVALELAAFLGAPFDSWRRMLARFALDGLNDGSLLGIVALSRAQDIRDRFLAVADPVQIDGSSAEQFFDDHVSSGAALGNTVIFHAGGELRSFIVIADHVIMGKGDVHRLSNDTHAPASLHGVLVHELTHARNADNIAALESTADTDPGVYVDTALAQTLTASTGPTSHVLHSYVAEITARHVHWVILQEEAGTPGGIAVRSLDPRQLAAAALFYFSDLPNVFDSNGYGRAIDARGDAARLPQLDLWLRLCAAQSFSADPAQDELSTVLFTAAAQACTDQLANPSPFPQDAGVFPGSADFV